MPRKPRSPEEKDRVRQRLCAGALELHQTRGYEAVSFRNLATLLGISHTLPYRYFADKDELMAQVRLNAFLDMEALIDSNDEDPAAPPIARLLSIADSATRYALAHPVEFQLMFAQPQPALTRYPPLLAARTRIFDRIVDVIQQAVDRGEIRGDARTLAHMAWASAYGLLSLHTADQLVHDRGLSELMPQMMRMLFGDRIPLPLLESRLRALDSLHPAREAAPDTAKPGARKRARR